LPFSSGVLAGNGKKSDKNAVNGNSLSCISACKSVFPFPPRSLFLLVLKGMESRRTKQAAVYNQRNDRSADHEYSECPERSRGGGACGICGVSDDAFFGRTACPLQLKKHIESGKPCRFFFCGSQMKTLGMPQCSFMSEDQMRSLRFSGSWLMAYAALISLTSVLNSLENSAGSLSLASTDG